MLIQGYLAGKMHARKTFTVKSIFYPEYSFQVSEAAMLDVSSAIGAARSAERLPFAERLQRLNAAADAFQYSVDVLEHTVKMSGLPVRVVRSLLDDIPDWFRQVSQAWQEKLKDQPEYSGTPAEIAAPGADKLLLPVEGYCYAVGPANDPRASALTAANCAAAGVPLIFKAARHDTAAPLVFESLISAGFDPAAFNLLYFDNREPDAPQKHHKLVAASSLTWTFGPLTDVDRALRYITDPDHPDRRLDLFADRRVLRHASAACSAVISGELDGEMRRFLDASLGFASGCTATRSVMAVRSPALPRQIAEYLASLRVGDPLQEETQVGYILPGNLDYLADLLQKHALSIEIHGGQRLSAHQMSPVLVTGENDLPELFGAEIPAYYLAVRQCDTLEQAVRRINASNPGAPRLAVSLYHQPAAQAAALAAGLRAKTVLLNQPTTRVAPFMHEGNDYREWLCESKLIIAATNAPE